MAKRGSCEIRVAMALLLALSAAAFSVSQAARVSYSAEGVGPVGESKQLRYPFMLPIKDPVVIRCAQTLVKADYCGIGLLEAVLSGNVNLTESCCVAINNMGDYCFKSIFPVTFFGVVLPREIKGYCAAHAPISSPPSA